MVFPGRISTGCWRCRSRKVKCDETKPTCRRCSLYGRPCPGYGEAFKFVRRERPAPATAFAPGGSESEAARVLNVKCTADGRPLPLVQVHFWLPWSEQTCLWYFMNRFVATNLVTAIPGHLSFLSKLYNDNNRGCLEWATLSAAHMAVHNVWGCRKALYQAYSYYGAAVRAIRDSLLTPSTMDSDKTIGAVILLTAFEDICGNELAAPHLHVTGLGYLLEYRGRQQLFKEPARELFSTALLRLHIYSVVCKDYRFADPGGYSDLMENMNPLWRARALACRIPRLCQELADCSQDLSQTYAPELPTREPIGGRDLQTVEPLIDRCLETLASFDSWDREATLAWEQSFGTWRRPPLLGQARNALHHYERDTAHAIILLRTVRVVLSVAILRYHDSLSQIEGSSAADHDKSGQLSEAAGRLRGELELAITDIQFCVPYALGDIDVNGVATQAGQSHDASAGLVLVHPLRFIANCAYLNDAQRKLGYAILERISKSMGIRSATSRADEERTGVGQHG